MAIRRMFGKRGIHHRGLIVAIKVLDEILLEADAAPAPELSAAVARRWTYEVRGGKTLEMPYWPVPETAFDDPDEIARWGRLALEAAIQAAS